MGVASSIVQERPRRIESQDTDIEIDYDVDIVVSSASVEEKIAAILYCFSNNMNGGHTVRTARLCAVNYTPVGEKTAYRIMRILSYRYGLIYFDTKRRRWLPTQNCPVFHSYDSAVEFVMNRRIVL